ncbi:MAG: PQQ-dependent sugar dehydrogenase [Sphingomonadales bacterium]|nr:PQQ-dependent sugar dehydrogenase [Sphingomonadales bacterium]
MNLPRICIRCLIISSLLVVACNKKADPPPIDTTTVPQLTISTLLTGYEIIWGFDFLPNGDLLFTEKQGKVYRYSNGITTELTGFPAVRTSGQGGLLDIRVHPDYASNGWVYACYAATATDGSGELRLIRFKIVGTTIQNIETIFQSGGGNTWSGHYGSRIAFDANRMLYLSIGEGGTGSYGGPSASNRNSSITSSNWGKIHRITASGGIPADNPVLPGQTAASTIFSYGIRNPQGMIIHPTSGAIWESEHGPKGGDEINLITRGANYGWPFYSLGTNYDNTIISQGHSAPGIVAPVFSWTPSVGVSGMAFINHISFKAWKGNLLVGGLAAQKLYRCVVNGNSIVSSDIVEGISGRVRHVVQGPNGSVYVAIEGPGRIVEIKAQ